MRSFSPQRLQGGGSSRGHAEAAGNKMTCSVCPLKSSFYGPLIRLTFTLLWLSATRNYVLAYITPVTGLSADAERAPQPRSLSFLSNSTRPPVAYSWGQAVELKASLELPCTRRFLPHRGKQRRLERSLLAAVTTPDSHGLANTKEGMPAVAAATAVRPPKKRVATFISSAAAAALTAAKDGSRSFLKYLRRGTVGAPFKGPSSRVVSFSRQALTHLLLLRELRSTLSLRLICPASVLSLVVGGASFCRSYFLGRLFDSAATLAQQHVPDLLLVQGGPQGVGAPEPLAMLLPLIVRIAGAAAVEVFGSISRDALFSCARWQLVVAMQKRLFSSLLKQDVAFFDAHSTGTLAGRLQVVTSGAQKLLSALVNVTVGGALMFSMSSSLAALGLVAVPCVWLGIGGAAKAIGNLGLLQNDLLADINFIATEILGNVRTVQTHGAEGLEIQRYSACQNASLSVLRESILAESFFKQTKQLLLLTTDLGLLALGMVAVGRGELTVGRFVSFRSYLRKFYFGVDKLADIYADLQYSLRASDRYFGLVDRQPAVADPKGDPAASRLLAQAGDGSSSEQQRRPALVEFKDVAFAYRKNNNAAAGDANRLTGPNVLDKFSLRIEPGEQLALVGPSGAGKSTIARLLQRFYDPQMGGVYLDGLDVKALPLQQLRSIIGFVEQEPLLFKRTIADNIGYGLRRVGTDSGLWLKHRKDRVQQRLESQRQQEPQQWQQQQQLQQQLQQFQSIQQQQEQELREEHAAEWARTISHPEASTWDPALLRRVFAAAAAANALAFVKTLPQGLFTVCGDGGVLLSGGQKQRIAVARALLREPRLLILDEASSCLDAESEAAICGALKKLRGKTTVLTIAHKHSTVKAADRVAVVDEGRLIESGTKPCFQFSFHLDVGRLSNLPNRGSPQPLSQHLQVPQVSQKLRLYSSCVMRGPPRAGGSPQLTTMSKKRQATISDFFAASKRPLAALGVTGGPPLKKGGPHVPLPSANGFLQEIVLDSSDGEQSNPTGNHCSNLHATQTQGQQQQQHEQQQREQQQHEQMRPQQKEEEQQACGSALVAAAASLSTSTLLSPRGDPLPLPAAEAAWREALGDGWFGALRPELSKAYFQSCLQRVAAERRKFPGSIFPPEQAVFYAFRATP
ncbi:hypothetical protein Esti_002359 [Eimeria stiedai]